MDLLGLVLVAAAVWWSGILNVVDRVPSPDGSIRTVVSEEMVANGDNVKVPTTTVERSGRISGTTNYLNSTYRGLW